MGDRIQYVISGSEVSQMEISTNSSRLDDPTITSSDMLDGSGRGVSDTLNLSIGYSVGLKEASTARLMLDVEDGGLYVSDFNITPRVRSVGAPQMLFGAIYGVALWSEKEEIYGLVDYSRIGEEAIINAGFPKNNIMVSEEKDVMFFSADLESVDYNEKDFTIVRE